MKVLLVCYANTCRSPVAQRLLETTMDLSSGVEVVSRGLVEGPAVAPEALREVAELHGLQLSTDPGVQMTRDDARSADVVLFMERALLREAVVTDTVIWPKSFTLLEFVRRAWTNPPERSSETFEQWLDLLHSGRRPDDLLTPSSEDDIDDPGVTGRRQDYEAMVDTLSSAVRKLVPFLTGWTSTTT